MKESFGIFKEAFEVFKTAFMQKAEGERQVEELFREDLCGKDCLVFSCKGKFPEDTFSVVYNVGGGFTERVRCGVCKTSERRWSYFTASARNPHDRHFVKPPESDAGFMGISLLSPFMQKFGKYKNLSKDRVWAKRIDTDKWVKLNPHTGEEIPLSDIVGVGTPKAGETHCRAIVPAAARKPLVEVDDDDDTAAYNQWWGHSGRFKKVYSGSNYYDPPFPPPAPKYLEDSEIVEF